MFEARRRGARAASPVHQHIGHRRDIGVHQRAENHEDLLSPFCREPPDRSKIQQGQTALRRHQNIPSMRIGVAHPLQQDHAQQSPGRFGRQSAGQGGLLAAKRGIGTAPADACADHGPFRGEPLMHERHMEHRRALADLRLIARLDPKIDLLQKRFAQLRHDTHGLVSAQRRHAALDDASRRREQPQIRAHDRLDSRPADLHDDIFTGP